MTVNGIDVASYQSTSYDTAGLGFVLVKATEGSSYTNPRHAGQVATGREHDLVVGHYHFVRPGPMTAQAAHFLRHAAPAAGEILALDWEDTDVSGAEKDAWIRHVQGQAPTHRVILYCNRDFWLNRDTTSFCGDGLWIADPGSPAGHPKVEHPWTFHQYSESAGLDHDVANFADKAALAAWARGKAPRPPAHEPFPGAGWFTVGRRSPVVAAMHDRLVAVGCDHYTSRTGKDVIGSGDIASYEAWQRKYNAEHHKGWSGAALKWPPGRETWNALKVPNV
jgi:hypothetical protein